MKDIIHFQVVTADEAVFDAMVNYVSAPLTDGEAGILANHAPMLASLEEGVVKTRFEGGEEYIAVSGGVLSVSNNEVIILARTAELAENIDVDRAQAAEKRAKNILEDRSIDMDMNRAEASLHRAIARQKAYSYLHK